MPESKKIPRNFTELYLEAYGRGKQDKKDNEDPKNNPYIPGSISYSAWRDGYRGLKLEEEF